MSWWKCPNTPPCPHPGVVHDVYDFDDPSPRCCIESCDCGSAAIRNRSERPPMHDSLAALDDIGLGTPLHEGTIHG